MGHGCSTGKNDDLTHVCIAALAAKPQQTTCTFFKNRLVGGALELIIEKCIDCNGDL